MKSVIKAVIAVVVLAGLAGAQATKWNVDVFGGIAASNTAARSEMPPPLPGENYTPVTSLGNFKDYNRAYFKDGVIVCQDTSVERATVYLDMNTHRVIWKGINETHVFGMTILDISYVKENLWKQTVLAVNLQARHVRSVRTSDFNDRLKNYGSAGGIQIVSASALDTADRGKWDAGAQVYLGTDAAGHVNFTSKLKCSSR